MIVFYQMASRKLFRSTSREVKYQIFFWLVRQALEKPPLLKHFVMRLVAITLSLMVQMSLALIHLGQRLRTMLLQFLYPVVAKLLSLMRLIISILIQLSRPYVELSKSFPQTAPSFSPVTSKIGSSILSTLVVPLSILNSTVLNKKWLRNSLSELNGFLTKKMFLIRKMFLRLLSQNIFRTIEELSMNFSDTLFLVPLMLVSLLVLLMYNLILLFQR